MNSSTKLAACVSAVLCVILAPGAGAVCKEVKGRVVSTLVSTYSNGDLCQSDLGLCTEGRFTGDLKGSFRFEAGTLTPFPVLDPTSAGDVAATTGVISLRAQRPCRGALEFSDTSAFSLSADGFVAALDTITSGTEACGGASGRVRIEGVFQAGCVDCRYRGEICGLPADDDDDDDDEDDD